MSDLLQELQRLGGTDAQADAVLAANAWAGTTGREFKDAINVACGTTGLEVQHALNVKAGTTQCDATLAASLIPSFPDLGSDLIARWVATTGVTDSSGTVTAWADQSGNGYDFDTITGTPTTGTRTVNRLNVIDMASGEAIGQAVDLTVAQPFVVALAVDVDAFDDTFVFLYGDDDDTHFFGVAPLAGPLFAITDYDAGTVSDTGSTGVHVIVAVCNGASSSLRVDGVEVATGTFAADFVATTASAVYTRFDGGAGEIVLHTGALSTDLEDYLIARWT